MYNTLLTSFKEIKGISSDTVNADILEALKHQSSVLEDTSIEGFLRSLKVVSKAIDTLSAKSERDGDKVKSLNYHSLLVLEKILVKSKSFDLQEDFIFV